MRLFESTKLGNLTLKNRVVMAPLTRSRAVGNIPNELMAQYYAQRAGAGLIITEGTSPSRNGLGYARIPGIFDRAQVDGWKKVTDAVHAKDGKIFIQLMHTGRVSHPVNMPEGAQVLAPSSIPLPGKIWTDSQGELEHATPKEMTPQEVAATVQEYVTSCKLAIEAGFDGVELHAANGYLIEQFLNPLSNRRTDRYGGDAEGRMRFLLEIAEGAAKAIGGHRVGVRVSPYGVFNGMSAFDGVDEFYAELIRRLSALGLAYIHVVDHAPMGAPQVSPEVKRLIRESFKGVYILSGGYRLDRAEADLAAGRGDLVAFGRLYISNPNLVAKLQNGSALKDPDPATFYTPGAAGYTDY